ncbi:Mbeg1-like protein [Salinisphaera sp.]|uniref:Mbeg1-like protein n=1 Tax=Salinisphaera sp. TaxID=1914330 RepID=UPI002D79CC3D|nr:Mbeg1-like protein [Salinisphaera sp.]HET7315263.1 Mbeg1-like protein [Salinisphaera sp.]
MGSPIESHSDDAPDDTTDAGLDEYTGDPSNGGSGTDTDGSNSDNTDPGDTSGGSGTGPGGGPNGDNPSPGANNPGDSDDADNADDTDSNDDDDGLDIDWQTILGIVTAAAEIDCLATPPLHPYWTAMDIAAYHAAKQAYETDGVGFAEQGIVYENPPPGFSASLTQAPSGRWIVAFRGTNPFSGADWRDNVDQALLGHSPQYEYAITLARLVKKKLGKNVLYVGHSLGGGMADAAAFATGSDAITFNAAGLHPNYRTGPPGSLRNHYIVGEVLTTLQTTTPLPDAPGVQIAHSASCTKDPGRRHSISTFHPPDKPGFEITDRSSGNAPLPDTPGDSPMAMTHDRSSGIGNELEMYVSPDKHE